MQKMRIQPYPLRISPDLRKFLESMAKAADRSLHKEIVRRLEQSKKQEELNYD